MTGELVRSEVVTAVLFPARRASLACSTAYSLLVVGFDLGIASAGVDVLSG